MNHKLRKRLISFATVAVMLGITAAFGLQTASATKIKDQESLSCITISLSATQRLEYCTGLSDSSMHPVMSYADITGQKLDANGTWVADDTILVGVSSIQLFVNDASVSSVGPISDPLVASYDIDNIPTPYFAPLNQPISLRVDAAFKYKIGNMIAYVNFAGKTVTRTYTNGSTSSTTTTSSTTSTSTTVPTIPPPGPTHYGSYLCSTNQKWSTPKNTLTMCAYSDGTHAGARIMAMRKTRYGWEKDIRFYVSVDKIRNIVNGKVVSSKINPTGPRRGEAATITLDGYKLTPGKKYTVSANATFGLWYEKSGQFTTLGFPSKVGTINP